MVYGKWGEVEELFVSCCGKKRYGRWREAGGGRRRYSENLMKKSYRSRMGEKEVWGCCC